MIIATDIYPADDPWLSLGFTPSRISSNTNYPDLTDSELQLSATLAQIDKFFNAATSQYLSKDANTRRQ